MALTPSQTTTVKAAILADPVLAPLTSGPGTDYSAIADALNADASPDYIVWRTSVTRDEIQKDDNFNWAQVDNLTNGSKYRIWEWMFDNANKSIDPSKANVRSGIDATWVGTAQLLAVRTAVYVHCKRKARRIEKILASGTGTDANPSTLGYEGTISISEIATMFNV